MYQTSPIVLASASPRRADLLRSIGVPFEVSAANVIEWEASNADPRELVAHNARQKALAVAHLSPRRLVLGSDTTVALEDQVLNKPLDLHDARRMLRLLSARKHTVFTAVTLVCLEAKIESSFIEATDVFFRPLTEALIDQYLGKVNVLDKAGAYAVQEESQLIVERLEGSFSNVIGLPVEALQRELVRLGYTF